MMSTLVMKFKVVVPQSTYVDVVSAYEKQVKVF